jgi:lysophospholipase L1-like esterase
VGFCTDAAQIHANVELDKIGGLLGGMTLQGAAGLDCYGRSAKGTWYWVGSICPSPGSTSFSGAFTGPDLDRTKRDYRIYLPLCTAVKSLRVGVSGATQCEPSVRDTRKPVVYYGTSIIQGVTASRPGMSSLAQLQRRLDYPVINLGFSGCGRMDSAVVDCMTKIDACVYVIDCLPNMDGSTIAQRVNYLVATLRRDHPAAPVLFVGDRLIGTAAYAPLLRELKADRDKAQHAAVTALSAKGVKGLHLYENANHFGEDFEGTVDGSHPSDLGAFRFMQALLQVIKPFTGKAQAR